jgi:hypothetical protein
MPRTPFALGIQYDYGDKTGWKLLQGNIFNDQYSCEKLHQVIQI